MIRKIILYIKGKYLLYRLRRIAKRLKEMKKLRTVRNNDINII